jgi:hypothetical protein
MADGARENGPLEAAAPSPGSQGTRNEREAVRECRRCRHGEHSEPHGPGARFGALGEVHPGVLLQSRFHVVDILSF